MAQQITQSHLDFVQEAKEAFEANPVLETYRNDDDTLIALRMGMDRDCVEVWELGRVVANFVQQMEPSPKPRKVVLEFAHDMEKQLNANEHKGGWEKEHHQDLTGRIFYNLEKLREELIKLPNSRDKHELTIRCANIANFAMMVADNKGDHL